MSPNCNKHCKNGSLQCPTPYTCGIYHLEAQLPLYVDQPGPEAEKEVPMDALSWRDVALISVTFLAAAMAIISLVGWSLK